MKVPDWEAVAREVAEWETKINAYWFGEIVRKHTREVPDGLVARMRAILPCSCAHDDHAAERATLLRDATPEACAALDAAPARVAELEARYSALAAEYLVKVDDAAEARREEVAATDAAEISAQHAAERIGALEAELRAESDRGDKLARRMTAEQEIARRRELRLTAALDLLDVARILFSRSGAEAFQNMAEKLDSFLSEPTSVPEPRDPFVCFALQYFVDGELDDERHMLFRAHLPDCTRCREDLETIQGLKIVEARMPTKETNRG